MDTIKYNYTLLNKLVNYLNDNAEDIETTQRGARANLDAWAESKRWLYDIMSQCEGWDAEDYSIVKRGVKCLLPADLWRFKHYVYNLLDLLNDLKIGVNAEAWAPYNAITLILNEIYFTSMYLVDEDEAGFKIAYKNRVIEAIDDVPALKNIRVGGAFKKALVNIMLTAIDDLKDSVKDCYEGLQRRASAYAHSWGASAFDALKERVKTYDLRLSINPLDFVSMSASEYVNSCHNIASGCFRQGCLSYMNDASSVIIKIYESADNIERDAMASSRSNIARAVLYLNRDAVMISRAYPLSGNQQALVDNIRLEALKALDLVPLATFNDLESFNNIGGVDIYSEGAHYRDYTSYDWDDDCGIIAYTLTTHEPKLPLEIGATAYCLTCGDYLDEDEESEISCCKYVYCSDCGERILREEAYNIDGDYYCGDCVRYCEDCGEYYRRDDVHDFDGDCLCCDCIRNRLDN